MRVLAAAILVLVVIAIGYPLVNEEADNVCSALERRLIMLSAENADPSATLFIGALQGTLSNGAVARSLMKRRNPDLPPFVACGIAYWRVLLDPGEARPLVNAVDLVPRGRSPAGGRASP